MSILIKGIDLPESGTITIRINRIGEVIPAYSIFGIPVAEAIEIPPHGRLIDADAKVKAMYYDEMTEEFELRTVRIIQVLADCVDDSIPIIIEAEE